MIKVERLLFVKVNKVDGVNKDTKIPFSFANVVLSNGLQSVELPLELSLVPLTDTLNQGDKVNVEIDLNKVGYNFKVNVFRISKVA